MKRKKFAEEQIIGIPKEAEAGAVMTAPSRKYAGLEVFAARRLRMLEDENARLKRLLADACWTTRS